MGALGTQLFLVAAILPRMVSIGRHLHVGVSSVENVAGLLCNPGSLIESSLLAER